MKVLIVVDMQNDFVYGSLGSKQAESIVKGIADYASSFEGEVVYTRDTNTSSYMTTEEGKNLPVVHCVKGTNGHEIVDPLKALSLNCKIIDKPTFGSVELGEYLKSLDDIESVTLVGLCTDICVISNALLIKAFLPNTPVFVKKDLCRGSSEEGHDNAINAMKNCQIHVI